MSKTDLRLHIISYDIADRKRLQKVHRYLKARAMPVQNSVFLAYCAVIDIQTILQEIANLINPVADDVRFYTLPRKAEVYTLGSQGNTFGVHILGTSNENAILAL